MLRVLAIAIAANAAPVATARPTLVDVEACDAALRNCRPTAPHRLDPQGREIWMRARIAGTPREPMRVMVSAIASSEVWFNGVMIGRNGRPGPSAAAEEPGQMDASFLLPAGLWRPEGNRIAIRLSSFHSPLRLRGPVNGIHLMRESAMTSQLWRLAPPLVAAGALLAGCLYFTALAILGRTRSSLLLAAMSGAAVVQAGAEMWRSLAPYAYPLHPVRLSLILAMAWLFAVLLAAFAAERFQTGRRWIAPTAVGLAGLALVLTPMGFDERTACTLALGAVAAAVPALIGVRRRAPGAWLAVGFLASFLGLIFIAPQPFLDLSFFMAAAVLTLALVVAEAARLRRLAGAREAELVRAAAQPDRLSVATAKGVEIVPLAEIAAIVGADDYAELRLTDGRTLLHAARLDHLAETLPERFVRIHRSAIANLAYATGMTRAGSRWVLEMNGGVALPVSRARASDIRVALATFSD